MGLVVGGTLVTAGLLITLGVSVLRNGDLRAVVEPSRRARLPRLKPEARLTTGMLYLMCGVAPLLALVITVRRVGGHQFVGWHQGTLIGLIGGTFLLAFSLVAILRPDVIIRWVESSYSNSQLADHPAVPYWVRGLGAFNAILSALALKSLR